MKKQFDWSRAAVHLGAWVTLSVMTFLYFAKSLSINPIQTLEHLTGKAALIFLMFSLACTPLGEILGWKDLMKRRQALGVYGFVFAALHLVVFLWLDYGFQFTAIWQVIKHSVYIWVGLAAFGMLLALAITSFGKVKQVLNKRWKQLHRLVYIISPLVVLHFLLVQKGNLFSLQGNLREPLIYGLIVAVLLILHIPSVLKPLTSLRLKLQNHLRRPNPV